VGYCGAYLPSDIIKINTLEELRTKIPQNIESLGIAIEDLEDLRNYGGGKIYHFPEVTWAHELKHLSNYKEFIVNHLNKEKDLLNYSKFDIGCSRDLSLQKIKEEMKGNFNNQLLDFEAELMLKQIRDWGSKADNATKYQIEQNRYNENNLTHNTKEVQDVITRYIDELKIIIAEIQFGDIIIEP